MMVRGLSPLNRVYYSFTSRNFEIRQTKDWFRYFYDALPEYNGMKMKSGTINDVKAFCGYQTAKDGNEYYLFFYHKQLQWPNFRRGG
jgi:D-alanyl-D-alanine carboxypeptidase/D-alanyl-D-alanine-endopeptidase (penicillin-binding protein 4)